MPVPPVLANANAYGLCWSGQVSMGANVRNPDRGTVIKNFHAYVELYEQAAHDSAIAGYLRRRGVVPRPPHRAQVVPQNANAAQPLLYYDTHGLMASRIVAQHMQTSWAAAAAGAGNATVFQQGAARPLAVQGVRQANGFNYDVTMWYDTQDIYVAFHCYHQ